MINTNTHLKSNKPFLLKPVGKDYLWGGTRLNDDFSKGIEMFPLAETWECSTHPNGLSIIWSGEYKERTLKSVLEEHPEFLGKHGEQYKDLPVLIKLIDANQDLSVQVHPDDEYAREHEHGQNGKTEFWYVLDATKEARVVYGFHHDCDEKSIIQSIENGSFDSYLQKIPIRKDDVFLINAGTVHAIGAGTLIAEIQQSSDLTYRLFDYNRIDKNGSKRELHISKALDVAELRGMSIPQQPMRVLRYSPGCATELLVRCQYFEVHRMLINTERIRKMVDFSSDDLSFSVLLCIDGCGVTTFDGESINIFKGDCLFIPANSVKLKIHGRMQLLSVSC